jgi:hypothetical protein
VRFVYVGRWRERRQQTITMSYDGDVRSDTPLFTGSCPVREHQAGGAYVGRCFHSTYGGVCHVHGDVSRWLVDGADLAGADDRLIDRGTVLP